MAGCGLGAQLFKENEKGPQILAATTNGSFGTQTFGISSETLGCTKDGHVQAYKRAEVYAEVNLHQISENMAKGGGEYLAGLAGVVGCTDQASFAKFTQAKYSSIFTSENTDSTTMLTNLHAQLAADPKLSQTCSI